MTMIITADSHLDHGLSGDQISHILKAFDIAGREGVIIQTLELPEELGTVSCALYGPVCGDPAVEDGKDPVSYETRGGRPYKSRMVAWRPVQTRLVSVIAGPHEGNPCVLYTAFGGPVAPKEPADPNLKAEERAESEAFWAEHALASLSPS